MPKGSVASGDGQAVAKEPLFQDTGPVHCVGNQASASSGCVGAGKLKIKVIPASGQNKFLRALYSFWGIAGAGKNTTVGLDHSAAFAGTAVASMAAAAAPFAPLVPLVFSLGEIVATPLLFAQSLKRKKSAASALLEAEGKMQKARACRRGAGNGADIIVIDLAEQASAAEDVGLLPEGQAPGEDAALQPGHAELEICRAQMDICAAKRKDKAARRGFIGSAIDLARDMVVQAGQFGSTLAYTLKAMGAPVAVVAQAAGTAMSAFGIAMGLGHIATGVYKLWRAYKDWRAARAYGTAQAKSDREQAYLASGKLQSEQKRMERLESALTVQIQKRALATNERLRKRAARVLRWESARTAYGVVGVVVGALSLTALMVGTLGLALPIVAGALGVAWLVFAAYKLYKNHRYEAKPQWHELCLAIALKEYPGKGAKQTLSDYGVQELRELAAWFKEATEDNVDLDRNPYFVAALATVALLKRAPADASGALTAKQLRLQASAALRISGMSKQMTQALKRGDFDHAYKAICEYLVADPARSTAKADKNEKAVG
jgi:hypothetical protein